MHPMIENQLALLARQRALAKPPVPFEIISDKSGERRYRVSETYAVRETEIKASDICNLSSVASFASVDNRNFPHLPPSFVRYLSFVTWDSCLVAIRPHDLKEAFGSSKVVKDDSGADYDMTQEIFLELKGGRISVANILAAASSSTQKEVWEKSFIPDEASPYESPVRQPPVLKDINSNTIRLSDYAQMETRDIVRYVSSSGESRRADLLRLDSVFRELRDRQNPKKIRPDKPRYNLKSCFSHGIWEGRVLLPGWDRVSEAIHGINDTSRMMAFKAFRKVLFPRCVKTGSGGAVPRGDQPRT